MSLHDGRSTEEFDDIPKVRPWIRYWARVMDILLFGIIVGIIQVVFFPRKVFDDPMLGAGLLIFWIFIEAKLLSTWGTTPGKWLLKTKVRGSDSNILTFVAALKRSFLVWLIGMGMGLFSLVTMIIAYLNLSTRDITSWDRQCGCRVIHEKIGFARAVAVVLIVLLFYLLVFVSAIIR
ncbi:MAG: RDD family protein [Bacillota bacterium]